MSCLFDFPTEVKTEGVDIVRGDDQAVAEVGAFLLALQDNPLPAGRQKLSPDDPTSFWIKLPCGVFVSWQIKATAVNMMRLAAGRVSPEIVVKVLGFGRDKPAKT
jgi:hypothetical protein